MAYRLKRFNSKLQRGSLFFKKEGVRVNLHCYFHLSHGSEHISIYLDYKQCEELRKCYLDRGVWMEYDPATRGYWSNGFLCRRGYMDDQRYTIPYKPYDYVTTEGIKELYCMTDIIRACGLIDYLKYGE